MSTIHFSSDRIEPGTGTADNPLKVDGDFDRAIATAVEKGVETIHLGPGTYLTRGIWAQPEGATFTSPVRLIGAGQDSTVIKLSPDAPMKNGATAVIQLGVRWKNNRGPWLVRGLTIDGNEGELPEDRLVLGGLVAHANRVQVEYVAVRNLRGKRATADEAKEGKRGFESFGILINNMEDGDHVGPDGGNIISGCTVVNNGDRNNYFTGIYPGMVKRPSNTIQNTVVTGCMVENIGRPTGIAYSFNENTTFIVCNSEGCDFAFYNDTDETNGVVIHGGEHNNIGYAACYIVSVRNTKKAAVLIRNADFWYAPQPGKAWMATALIDHDGTKGVFKDIEFIECRFSGKHDQPFTIASLKGSNIQPPTFHNCVFPDRKTVMLQNGAKAPRINGKEWELL